MSQPLFHRASLFSRFAAHLLDRLLLYVCVVIANLPTIVRNYGDTTYVPWFLAPLSFVITVGYLFWFGYAAFKGSTPGKRMGGLKLITSKGHTAGFVRVILRETVGKVISSFFAVGFIWAFLHDERRALHDLIFDTHVVEAAKYRASTEQQETTTKNPPA